jgi:hypothetical protein
VALGERWDVALGERWVCVCVWGDAICVGGEGRRVERRLSFEPSRMQRAAERARAAGASVAATSGE